MASGYQFTGIRPKIIMKDHLMTIVIKRMIITSAPVTLGSGISFLDEEDWNKFELESETKMKNSCIKKVYTPKKL